MSWLGSVPAYTVTLWLAPNCGAALVSCRWQGDLFSSVPSSWGLSSCCAVLASTGGCCGCEGEHPVPWALGAGVEGAVWEAWGQLGAVPPMRGSC